MSIDRSMNQSNSVGNVSVKLVYVMLDFVFRLMSVVIWVMLFMEC